MGVDPDLLRALISMRRLFDETITIEFYTSGDADGYPRRITINTKKDSGEPVTIELEFTWTFEAGKLVSVEINKTVS